MVTDWVQPKRISFYFYYWSIYLLVFSIIEGIPANAFGSALLGELCTLLPKIAFVTLVAEWLFDQYPIQRYPFTFGVVYLTFLLVIAFVLRLIDNYIIIPYLLPHWIKEPLLSAPPFLYNAIKLQFLVAIPLIMRFAESHSKKISASDEKTVDAGMSVGPIAKADAATHKAYLNITSDRRLISIAMEDIIYFETRGNQILIYTGTKCIRTYLTVSKLQEQLPVGMFVRVHRSFIVSLSRVSSFSAAVVVVGETKIPVGRAYREEIKKINFKD